MKKTLTVNLGGTVYHIDEDAFHLLDNYLSNLKNYFRRQQGAEEIVNDVENRIAELFAEKIGVGKEVITITDVEEVIARMGKPEDFGAADDEASPERPANDEDNGEQAERRLFRDPDRKALGGVAAGLAAYFDWEVTLTRVIIVCLAVPFPLMLPLYIVAWILIPEARTAADKLNMRGKKVTVESIGQTVTDSFERVSERANDYINSGRPRATVRSAADVLVSIATVLVKIFLVIVLIACLPVLFGVAFGLVASVIALFVALFGGGSAFLQGFFPPELGLTMGVPTPVAGVFIMIVFFLTIGIPVGAFIYALMRRLFNWQPMGKGSWWTLFILWMLSFFASCYFFFQYVLIINGGVGHYPFYWLWD
ncbi:MAG: PspC domain-containing protein [Mediterranea sp.]|jgi:phage shock protein PspC (stress-responsive transcriptional regulator)|nr:PspC domain-containing protein [Mediterranea sp.]